MSKLTLEQLVKARNAASEVLTALAGTNDDLHRDNSEKMVEAWDALNDRFAPPAIVKAMADELIELRQTQARRIAEKQAGLHHGAREGVQALVDMSNAPPALVRGVAYRHKISADNLPKDTPVSLCEHEWVASEGRTASGWLCRKCGDYNGPRVRGKGVRYTKG